MIERGVKIPTIIMLAMKGTAFLIGIIVIIFQKPIISLWSGPKFASILPIIPVQTCISALLGMILYIVFAVMIFTYKGSKRFEIGITFLIIHVLLFVIMNYFFEFSFIFVTKTTVQIGLESTVGNVISNLTSLLEAEASALYFFICGKYTINRNK